jgi:uncharacterized membrane protein YdjX (TVP38/TMEM64 family)
MHAQRAHYVDNAGGIEVGIKVGMSSSQPPPAAQTKPRVLLLAVAVCVLLLVLVSGVHRYASLAAIIEFRQTLQTAIQSHYALALAGYIIIYIAAVAVSLPGAAVLTVAGGLMFGTIVGGIAAVCAATAGACVVFLIARTAAGGGLAGRVGPHVAKLQAGFCENAGSYMLFLRLAPVVPFFVVNIVPALLGVRFRTYLMGTFFGIMPASFAFSSAGAGLDSAVTAAKAVQARCIAANIATNCPLSLEPNTLLTPQLKLAFALLSMLALIPIGIKIWRRRHVH